MWVEINYLFWSELLFLSLFPHFLALNPWILERNPREGIKTPSLLEHVCLTLDSRSPVQRASWLEVNAQGQNRIGLNVSASNTHDVHRSGCWWSQDKITGKLLQSFLKQCAKAILHQKDFPCCKITLPLMVVVMVCVCVHICMCVCRCVCVCRTGRWKQGSLGKCLQEV